jgi:hypothetical protein
MMTPAKRQGPEDITTPSIRIFSDTMIVMARYGWPSIICMLVTVGAVWGGCRIVPAIVAEYEEKTAATRDLRTAIIAIKDTMAKMAIDMENRRAEFARYEAADVAKAQDVKQLLEDIKRNQERALTNGKTSGVGEGLQNGAYIE